MASSSAAARGARRAVLYLLILAGAVQARPGPPADPERKLKAAYLYRVATFVDWPDAAFARPDAPLLVGVAGDDALAAEAERFVEGRLVHGRTPDAVRSQPVLTVCDGAPGRGCVVGLAADGDHLRLRIDRLEAMAAQLRISARLLALAAR